MNRSLPVLGTQLGEIEIARWPDEQVDLLQRMRRSPARGTKAKAACTNRGIVHGVVHQNGAGLAQLEGGRIEVADGAQARLLADGRRIGKQLRHDDIKQVKHVVLRTRFQRAHEGQQRRHAALLRHARDGLRLGDSREAGERRHAAGRDVGRPGQACGQQAHLVETFDSARQLGAAAQVRPVAQPIERARPAVFRTAAVRRAVRAAQA